MLSGHSRMQCSVSLRPKLYKKMMVKNLYRNQSLVNSAQRPALTQQNSGTTWNMITYL
ncbi:hypothetical protein BofuT4_P157820.1 [Botrytis cinerea T4]|uniref:Uncharacterized protein n=1 Tax=Botryotinia fuckeliana (strain T4) TaxID=999810 RepID=G2YUT8_BOTF4|nr:hypothetical protein BofuT4_P157820.1 [Botrytis cinerea T4]